MKAYVKPNLEVISMKTTENVADNLLEDVLKAVYVKSNDSAGYVAAANSDEIFDAQDIADSAVN